MSIGEINYVRVCCVAAAKHDAICLDEFLGLWDESSY